MQTGLTDAVTPFLANNGWQGSPSSFDTWWRPTQFQNSMIDAPPENLCQAKRPIEFNRSLILFVATLPLLVAAPCHGLHLSPQTLMRGSPISGRPARRQFRGAGGSAEL